MKGEWRVDFQLRDGARSYVAMRQLNELAPVHEKNVEYYGKHTANRAQARKLCDKLNGIERINKILEMYWSSATRQDMQENINVYLVQEILKCNIEESTLLEIVERFLAGKETLGYIHELLMCHYENM